MSLLVFCFSCALLLLSTCAQTIWLQTLETLRESLTSHWQTSLLHKETQKAPFKSKPNKHHHFPPPGEKGKAGLVGSWNLQDLLWATPRVAQAQAGHTTVTRAPDFSGAIFVKTLLRCNVGGEETGTLVHRIWWHCHTLAEYLGWPTS